MRAGIVAVAALALAGALSGCGGSALKPPDGAATPAPSAEGDIGAADGYLVPEGLSTGATLPQTSPDSSPGAATPEDSPSQQSKPSPKPAGKLYGGDISWPQCPKGMGIPQKQGEGMPMPTEASRFVIIGLTNGPSFYPNPCLESQLAWVRQRQLYVAAYAVVSYPHGDDLKRHGGTGPYDGSTRLGALRNVGYQAALFNIATMKRVGFRTPIVWIDVEPVRVFEWSSDTQANAAVVQGTAKAYKDAGYRIGFYSTPALWRHVVGGLSFGEPEWRAAGPTSEAEAVRRCAPDWSIQGGTAVLGQWVEDRRDRNVTCPGAMPDPAAWFERY